MSSQRSISWFLGIQKLGMKTWNDEKFWTIFLRTFAEKEKLQDSEVDDKLTESNEISFLNPLLTFTKANLHRLNHKGLPKYHKTQRWNVCNIRAWLLHLNSIVSLPYTPDSISARAHEARVSQKIRVFTTYLHFSCSNCLTTTIVYWSYCLLQVARLKVMISCNLSIYFRVVVLVLFFLQLTIYL